jgi:uncharacterized protein YceK
MVLRQTGTLLVALTALSALGGCATYGSLGGKDGAKVYGGTRLDATIIADGLAPASEVAKSPVLERPVLVWAACCGLVDLPFSVLADTALLPLTVPLAFRENGTEAQTAGPTSGTDKVISQAGSFAK